MATIREISEKANVSIATVSKVLNGKPGVNAETRETILNVARELNYRPNLNARNLKSGRTNTIGVITGDLTAYGAPEIVDGITLVSGAAGYHCILGNLRLHSRHGEGPADRGEYGALVHAMVEDLLSKQVDGVIYVGCRGQAPTLLPEHRETKFVCAGCISGDPAIPSILANDEQGARTATELLLRRESNAIGMIAGPRDSLRTAARTLGHQEAFYLAGVPYNPRLTLFGDWSRDCGRRLGERLIRAGAKAIFAHSDRMAMGVLDYCFANGIEVGKELFLIGFGSRAFSAACQPALSTVAPPFFEIGRTAARVMLDALAGTPEDRGEILLDCALLERESTGDGEQPVMRNAD